MLSVTSLNVSTPSYALFGDNATTTSVSLGNSIANGVTKYRILALSEGVHNNLIVKSEDIRQMVYDVTSNPSLVIPVVLDHSFNFNDIVGKVLNIQYFDQYTMPNGNILHGAAVAEIELLASSEGTPKLNETLYRMQMLPELAKFSVAFKFVPTTDAVGNVTVHDLKLQHIAIVTNPADPATGIIEKFSKRESFGSLSYDIDMDNLINRGNKMPSRKTTQFNNAPRRSARFNNSAAEDIARNALPLTGTYPIRDVQSINLAPKQRSPLMCGCGEDLYNKQMNKSQPADIVESRSQAAFRARQKARLNATRNARYARNTGRFAAQGRSRFANQGRTRFAEYGVPYASGNPFGYPISDTYPNVNQLISLRNKSARLGKRGKLLTEKEEDTRFARKYAGRFANGRRSRFDDDMADFPTAPEQYDYDISDNYAPVAQPAMACPACPPCPPCPQYGDDMAPVYGNVSEYDSYAVDPVVNAYIDAGLIYEDEIPVVEAALRSYRSQFARKRASLARRNGARMSKQTSPRGKFAATKKSSKFDGLINEYMLPSANIPEADNINIRRNAEFAARRKARLSARNGQGQRGGSFFACRGKVPTEKKLSNSTKVPVQNTSISQDSTANTAPATFVGNNVPASTNSLMKELSDTKAALADANELTNLRATAMSMNFADKDLIATFNKQQLTKFIESKGFNQTQFAGQMNPFVSPIADQEAVGNYIAEFADNFTKGTQKRVATISQTSPSAEAKAEQLFGGN